MTANHTKVIGASTVNEIRLGAVRWNQYIESLLHQPHRSPPEIRARFNADAKFFQDTPQDLGGGIVNAHKQGS